MKRIRVILWSHLWWILQFIQSHCFNRLFLLSCSTTNNGSSMERTLFTNRQIIPPARLLLKFKEYKRIFRVLSWLKFKKSTTWQLFTKPSSWCKSILFLFAERLMRKEELWRKLGTLFRMLSWLRKDSKSKLNKLN